MSAIKLLPDSVINKIKAGEMIERPANVVKELVENALDADATKITVALTKGGLDEIVVTDNGVGIAPDDVPHAIRRHATSKIARADDLFALQSLGFRGEALASISEVAKFTLITATANANTDTATKLEISNHSHPPVIIPWSAQQGTSINVKDLFYNIPVRQKFMKSQATEYSHCANCIHALCLSHPQIEFVLTHNNREQLHVPHADETFNSEQTLRQRAEVIYGKESATRLLYAMNEDDYARVELLFSPPNDDRAHVRHMFTFINNRWIKNTTLKYGILRGYHSHLAKGRYPAIIARIKMHPSLLDVNVHPMKTEVRFQYAQPLQELLAITIRKELRSPTWSLPVMPTTENYSPRQDATLDDQKAKIRPTQPRSTSFTPPSIFFPKSSSSFTPPSLPPPSCVNERKDEEHKTQFDWQTLTYIGCFARCYLLFADDRDERLLVVDQHAFHERIIYEELCADPKSLTRAQRMLIPDTVQISAEDTELVKKRQTEFRQLGFTLDIMNNETIAITSVPVLLQDKDCVKLVQDLIQLAHRDHTSWIGETLVHDVIATIACRAAIKAGEILEENRLQRLFAIADNVDFYHNCPHGRPVFKIHTRQEVGQWFDRP